MHQIPPGLYICVMLKVLYNTQPILIMHYLSHSIPPSLILQRSEVCTHLVICSSVLVLYMLLSQRGGPVGGPPHLDAVLVAVPHVLVQPQQEVR